MTVPEPAGATAWTRCGLRGMTSVAGVDPNSTALALDRFEPLIRTSVPPVVGPWLGVSDVTFGVRFLALRAEATLDTPRIPRPATSTIATDVTMKRFILFPQGACPSESRHGFIVGDRAHEQKGQSAPGFTSRGPYATVCDFGVPRFFTSASGRDEWRKSFGARLADDLAPHAGLRSRTSATHEVLRGQRQRCLGDARFAARRAPMGRSGVDRAQPCGTSGHRPPLPTTAASRSQLLGLAGRCAVAPTAR